MACCLYETYLDCNGYEFIVGHGGTLEQTGGLVNLDRGTLQITGAYSMQGSSTLQMICAEDLLQVRGDFNTESTMNHSTMLTNGRMELTDVTNEIWEMSSAVEEESGNFTEVRSTAGVTRRFISRQITGIGLSLTGNTQAQYKRV